MANFLTQLRNFLIGQPEEVRAISNLTGPQQELAQTLMGAIAGSGAGGAFGDVADYYRSLLSEDPAAMEAFSAPEMRRFEQDIIPQLAERFAGMGSGALSGSGFRNAALQEAGNLSERLASMRAGLQQQGAAGLGNLASAGLQPQQEAFVSRGTRGLIPTLASGMAPGIGQAGTMSGLNQLKQMFGSAQQGI